MKHFLLFYDYVPDYVERRGPFRAAHFNYAQPYLARGELVLAGACTDDGPPIAVLLFKTESRETAQAYARADPYVVNGLVSAWRVREWTTVAGKDALTKVSL